jgi:cobalamin biosynthesis Mg chelatase CobN
MSAIALALLCFPVLAQAEDSSGVQYSDSIPKAEGENTPTHQSHRGTPAKSSSTDQDGGASAPSSTKGSGASGGSSEGESKPSSAGGIKDDNSDGTGQGSPGGGGQAKAQPDAQSAAGTAPAHSSDDGSSPLIPILIAILVLAAISVGVVMYRQRRGPDAGAASPKAS